jgi:hypothetical protein
MTNAAEIIKAIMALMTGSNLNIPIAAKHSMRAPRMSTNRVPEVILCFVAIRGLERTHSAVMLETWIK